MRALDQTRHQNDTMLCANYPRLVQSDIRANYPTFRANNPTFQQSDIGARNPVRYSVRICLVQKDPLIHFDHPDLTKTLRKDSMRTAQKQKALRCAIATNIYTDHVMPQNSMCATPFSSTMSRSGGGKLRCPADLETHGSPFHFESPWSASSSHEFPFHAESSHSACHLLFDHLTPSASKASMLLRITKPDGL